MSHRRSEPYLYTKKDMIRRNCERCETYQASEQWSLRACAVGKEKWYAVCVFCDIVFNEDSLNFVRHPDREKLISRYIARQKRSYVESYTDEQFERGLEYARRY